MVIRQSDSAWKVETGEKYLFIFTFLRARKKPEIPYGIGLFASNIF